MNLNFKLVLSARTFSFNFISHILSTQVDCLCKCITKLLLRFKGTLQREFTFLGELWKFVILEHYSNRLSCANKQRVYEFNKYLTLMRDAVFL